MAATFPPRLLSSVKEKKGKKAAEDSESDMDDSDMDDLDDEEVSLGSMDEEDFGDELEDDGGMFMDPDGGDDEEDDDEGKEHQCVTLVPVFLLFRDCIYVDTLVLLRSVSHTCLVWV